MPYTIQDQRDVVDTNIDALVEAMNQCVSRFPNALKGLSNYTITEVLLKAMKPSSGWNYSSLADVVATLECSKLEIYRRLIAPYEEKAISKNGDLPELSG